MYKHCWCLVLLNMPVLNAYKRESMVNLSPESTPNSHYIAQEVVSNDAVIQAAKSRRVIITCEALSGSGMTVCGAQTVKLVANAFKLSALHVDPQTHVTVISGTRASTIQQRIT